MNRISNRHILLCSAAFAGGVAHSAGLGRGLLAGLIVFLIASTLSRLLLRLITRLRAARQTGQVHRLLLAPLIVVWCASGVSADEAAPQPVFARLAGEYSQTTQPLLRQFCLGCHSTEKQEGELDLERFRTLDDLRRDSKTWLKVVEMLDTGEMPPKDSSPQPTVDQIRQLRRWIQMFLDAEALAGAGDPGPVVLRRLNNAEYTFTIRDLTGVDLNPAREFPADNAAGEGFTNAGGAMVMSPALLTKYLDAGKDIARHAVLLPDGFRFSPSTNPGDWTSYVLARIREFYRQHSDAGGGTQVNLQGIVFDTNSGGRLDIEKYIAGTIEVRERLTQVSGSNATEVLTVVARDRRLNLKYLGLLWTALNDRQPSLLMDVIRSSWREARRDQAARVAAEIAQWQQALWRFTSVGHIGKLNGPKAWQEPVQPLAVRQDIRFKLPVATDQSEVVLYLATTDAGDGTQGDSAVWERPRFVRPGQPDLLLKDVRAMTSLRLARRERLIAGTIASLTAANEAAANAEPMGLETLAKTHHVQKDVLAAWLEYLGIGSGSAVTIDSHFKEKFTSAAGYDFVKGWGPPATPNMAANSSDTHVRIPGNLKPHSVAMHPSPTLNVVAGWRSPVSGTMTIRGQVQHAHPECGNGVTWTLELRRGSTRQKLAAGIAHGSKEAAIGPLENLTIRKGDVVSLVIGPRDGNHSCDLTAVDLTLQETASANGSPRRWNLGQDVSPDVLAGNPHADRFGHPDVWHFYTEPVRAGETGTIIPEGSVLAKWLAANDPAERQRLAQAAERLLRDGSTEGPDELLRRQLMSLGGPLVAAQVEWMDAADFTRESDAAVTAGLDASLFGKSPQGLAVDDASLSVQAPSVIAVRLPADLVAGMEFVTTGALHPESGDDGSVQMQVLSTRPERTAGLLPTAAVETKASGPWTSNNRGIAHATPVLVRDGSTARRRIEAGFDDFRHLFPLALCYTKIVPVDEVVTLTLFYREDQHLQRLMLDDVQTATLNRLWDELHFISRDALTLVDAYEQLMEYATQDADPKVFEPLRQPIQQSAAEFRKTLLNAEPRHVEQLIAFADRAWRRPLIDSERDELRSLYRQLRAQELPHEEVFRFTLARIFIAPAFLYRLEQNVPGSAPGPSSASGPQSHPVSDHELATRLSYFLWSSLPDTELRQAADAGRLREPQAVASQARRLLKDPRVRRLATEFACQWLHIYDFESLDEKSEKLFPEFAELRRDMSEESITFFTDVFQNDGSLLTLFDADHTFVNERLAKFYGLPFDAGRASQGWLRVDGVRGLGRGGLLGMAAPLAKQSGASRTSPILRGNWISEVLLGEKLPKPPKDVPLLPDEDTEADGLTVRQLVERHTTDARCSGCHQRIDPFGFALEEFDAIGRRRTVDHAGRALDVRSTLPDGTSIEGLSGLRDYLLTKRRDTLIRQFCRKLLGYSLGRSVQLSDEPLLSEIQQTLSKNDYRFSAAVEKIVTSRQFREVRTSALAAAAD